MGRQERAYGELAGLVEEQAEADNASATTSAPASNQLRPGRLDRPAPSPPAGSTSNLADEAREAPTGSAPPSCKLPRLPPTTRRALLLPDRSGGIPVACSTERPGGPGVEVVASPPIRGCTGTVHQRTPNPSKLIHLQMGVNVFLKTPIRSFCSSEAKANLISCHLTHLSDHHLGILGDGFLPLFASVPAHKLDCHRIGMQSHDQGL